MIAFCFLLLLLTQAWAKCGVTYIDEIRSWDNHGNTHQQSSYQNGHDYGYAHRGLQESRFCQDLEQFEQCKAAQQIIDEVAFSKELQLTLEQRLLRPKLECYKYITCYYGGEGQGSFYCESQEMHQECLRSQTVLNDFATAHGYGGSLPEIICFTDVESKRSVNSLPVYPGISIDIPINQGTDDLTAVNDQMFPSTTSTTNWPTFGPRTEIPSTSVSPEVVAADTTEDENDWFYSFLIIIGILCGVALIFWAW